jgi:ATP-dependent helicase/nuclease subunit A
MSLNDQKPQRSENDSEQRRRAVREASRSFVVEASAGTGKTRTLIDRILNLVLVNGLGGSPLPLSRICAITFTEKAAGEMKVRLQQHFEQSLLDQRGSTDYRLRAGEALSDLDTAAISTFHSFAVSLLKERPIEAGLDPHFTALDDMQSELLFREVWESWISRALSERNPSLEKALRNGFRLESLEKVARILRLRWLNVRELAYDCPPTEEYYLEKMQGFMSQGKAFLHQLIEPKDRLAGRLQNALNWLERPNGDADELSRAGNIGSARNWSDGKNTVKEVQDFLREIVEFRASYKSLPLQQLLNDVVMWIKHDFMNQEWEKRKQAEGLLDFDDQLWRARDLLRNPEMRRAFQDRYASLLVDEFQDTDPIQWEIVLLLTSTDVEEKDISRLRPEPGRLFIVGDPKQSIYRFRGADIETYLDIVDPQRMESLGMDRLKLTTNFRSVPSILRFVDAAFEDVMKPPEDGCRYQPDYLAFGDYGNRKEELHPSAVNLLGDNSSESGSRQTVREFIERESSRIAKLIREIHDSETWKIHDPAEKAGNGWRLPQYGDIAILLPVLTHTDLLEEALRDLGIPYVLEGGKFYYSRSEVSAAITILRSVAAPNDSVALYGSLRSIFFGFSDEDLLRAHFEGLALDYRENVPHNSPFYHPFEILRDLHRYRHERRASETFEILLQETGAREVLAARGLQSLANLNKLGRTLRALQGEATFAQVVDLLSTMDEEGLAESESRLMEERSNAVRVMSIHKAKGLDFPIVFVAALGLKMLARGKNILADPHRRKIFALNIGARDSGLQTPSWRELAEEEKRRENAELARLLYVGLTRARDYLILSTHTAGWKKPDHAERWVPDMEGTRLKPLSSFLTDCLLNQRNLVRLIDVASLDSATAPPLPVQTAEAKNLQSIVEGEYWGLHRLLDNTPSARRLRAAGQSANDLDQEDSFSEERLPEAVGSRAARLGTAFHKGMERVDLFCRNGLIQYTQELGTQHRLDRESAQKLEEMIRMSLNSELLERARAAVRSGGRILREVPFVRPLHPATVEEGKIDLLFEEKRGWVLVDYKTDDACRRNEVIEGFFRNKYSAQIREYVDALRALSVKVTSAYLLLARTGDAIEMF